MRNWISEGDNIRKQKSKRKNVEGSKALYPLLVEELLRQFREQRNLGKMLEKYPTVTNFKYSNRWFNLFCWRNKLSLRRKTHVSHKAPSQRKNTVKTYFY